MSKRQSWLLKSVSTVCKPVADTQYFNSQDCAIYFAWKPRNRAGPSTEGQANSRDKRTSRMSCTEYVLAQLRLMGCWCKLKGTVFEWQKSTSTITRLDLSDLLSWLIMIRMCQSIAGTLDKCFTDWEQRTSHLFCHRCRTGHLPLPCSEWPAHEEALLPTSAP